jgi:CRISPR-associated protein Csx10
MIVRYVPYTLSFRSPAVLTSLSGDLNSSRTLPFIPGAALRGAAARGLGDPQQDAERTRTFRSLILDGHVRFFNAYPRAGGRRTLPAPMSLRLDKKRVVVSAGDLLAWDLAAFTGKPDTDDASWPEASLSPLPEPFISLGAAQPLRVEPNRGSRIHQQRDRSSGRAWKEERDGREEAHGALFAFEFLEAGQEFGGLVQVCGNDDSDCDALIDTVRSVLTEPLLLGRSRRGGYGGDATLTWGVPCDREVDGQGLVSGDLPADAVFRILLTSSYVGRDPDSGQLDPSQLETEVVRAFEGRVAVVRRRWRFELAGGFNRKWHLELPQALTCAAGSALVLKTTAPILLSELLAVEHAGLGERRVEGFGRILFLQAPSPTLTLRMPSPTARTAPTGVPPELVRVVEGRILNAKVERVIEEEAARLARTVRSSPSRSLLGRLRTAMRAEPQTALATLQTWLAQEGNHRLRRTAMEQLERCRIGSGERLSVWLRKMAGGQDNQIAEILRIDTLIQRSHIVSEATAKEYWTGRVPWLRARLVDSTLAALARNQRQRRSP